MAGAHIEDGLVIFPVRKPNGLGPGNLSDCEIAKEEYGKELGDRAGTATTRGSCLTVMSPKDREGRVVGSYDDAIGPVVLEDVIADKLENVCWQNEGREHNSPKKEERI